MIINATTRILFNTVINNLIMIFLIFNIVIKIYIKIYHNKDGINKTIYFNVVEVAILLLAWTIHNFILYIVIYCFMQL